MTLNPGQSEHHRLNRISGHATGSVLHVAATSLPARTRRATANGTNVESQAGSAIEPAIEFARVRPAKARRLYAFSKRAFDLVAGSLVLLITLPIVMAAAGWIWIESSGSPFFFQTRLGNNGRPFRIFKLRGMYIDARSRFPELYDYSQNRDLDFHFHYNVDPRVTRAGRFLRRTSIDELPNLWNVVMGDMSLVGPRPEIPEILDLYGSYREEYLSVKPGITCLSKCKGRDRLTKRESVQLDLQYIRQRGFRKDAMILWKTFTGVVFRRDVY